MTFFLYCFIQYQALKPPPVIEAEQVKIIYTTGENNER